MYRRSSLRRGQTIVEYGLLLMLIAILVFGAVQLVGGNINASFSSTNSSLNGGGSGGSGGGGGNPADFVVVTPTPSEDTPVEFDGPDTATDWDWDFGDGSPHATTEDPSHTYTDPGTYTVTLITNEGTSSLAIDVVTPTAPVVSWTTLPAPPADPFPGMGVDPDYYWDEPYTHYIVTGSPVAFDDTSTGTITSWNWEYNRNFGGWTSFATEADPTYTFAQAGGYQIRLTVTGPLGTVTETAPQQGFPFTFIDVSDPLTVDIENADALNNFSPCTESWCDTPAMYNDPDNLTWYDGSTINVYAKTNGTSGPNARTVCNWTMTTDTNAPNTGSASGTSFWEDGVGNEWISALASTHYPKNDSGSIDDEPEDNFGAIQTPRIFEAGAWAVSVSCTNPLTGTASDSGTITILAGP